MNTEERESIPMNEQTNDAANQLAELQAEWIAYANYLIRTGNDIQERSMRTDLLAKGNALIETLAARAALSVDENGLAETRQALKQLVCAVQRYQANPSFYTRVPVDEALDEAGKWY